MVVVPVNTTPPNEFTAIGLDAGRFQKVGPNEYHGPCPHCFGDDRFVIFTDRQFPSWWYFCRVCTPAGDWIDKLNPRLRVPLSDEQKREYAKERQVRERQRANETRQALARFTTEQLWAELHRRMSEQNRAWWRWRGVPDEWQDYLQLGYTPDKVIRHDGELYHTPAYTIPYLRRDGNPVTMQYRLMMPPEPNDKYRFEAGLSAAWYAPEPYDALLDQVVICEGAIKSIVTRVYGGLGDDFRVLGVPSKNAWAGISDLVHDCGRVWVILDPDGQHEAAKLAREIGKAARVVMLPGKIDDMLTDGEFTGGQLRDLFRTARKL